MRVLALSIGNTSIRGAVFADRRVAARFRASVRDVATASGLARLVAPHIRGRIDGVAICSVVPALTARIVRGLERALGFRPRVLVPGSDCGIRIAYRRPRELGADRLAAALGVRDLFPGRHAIVVDCGTATTATALRRDGTVLGGAIMPGIELWSDMLAARTAQLPVVPVRKVRTAVGRSAREAIAAGVFIGHVGAVRELVSRVRAEAFGRAPALVVGTGGNAPHFEDEELFDHIEPDLVLHGLRTFVRSANLTSSP
jgi:type III pantothenate kinase